MPRSKPIPPKLLVAVLVLGVAGCQPANAHPVPSVPQIGANLKCAQGDHPYVDPQLGWGFCYPATWRYIVRPQNVEVPKGVDLTFDITCLSSCMTATPSAAPGVNLFGFMIVSTYERAGAADLSTWWLANYKAPFAADPVAWGDASEAGRMKDGRWVAMTPHFVVILDVRSGLLDVQDEMASRLETWKFPV